MNYFYVFRLIKYKLSISHKKRILINSKFVINLLRNLNDKNDDLYTLHNKIIKNQYSVNKSIHTNEFKVSSLVCNIINYFKLSSIFNIDKISNKIFLIAKKQPQSKFYTVKNNESTIKREQLLCNSEDIYNIEFIKSTQEVLNNTSHLDLIIVDAQRSKNRIFKAYNYFLNSDKDFIFVVSNIYKNPAYYEFWKEIKNNPKVNISLNLFYAGIAIKKNGELKQTYNIKL